MLSLKQGEGPPADRRLRFHGDASEDEAPEPCPPLPPVLELCNSCDHCDAFVEAVGLIDVTDGTWKWTALDHYYTSISDTPTPVIDPWTVETRADLSREDHAVLYRECRGRTVVEFGAGGSTQYLCQFAAAVHSFETDPRWVSAAYSACGEVKQVCPVSITHMPKEALCAALDHGIDDLDVHFVDGLCELRGPWVRHVLNRRLAPVPKYLNLRTILVHDVRRPQPLASLGFLLEYSYASIIRSLEFEGNLLIIRLRKEAVSYENWNETEPDGRKGFLL